MVDPRAFDWPDAAGAAGRGAKRSIYELHVGTFSPEGTFAGVERRLDYLADLGVTAIELMPLADFPGRRNWGYDGVLPYAPDAAYGTPEDLKRLVAAAHARGLMVLLDVVYNHFGPEGNYLHAYAPQFFTDRHQTAVGRGDQLRRRRLAHRARLLHPQRALLARGVSLRRAALRRGARDRRRFEPAHPRPSSREAVRAGPGATAQIHLVLENDRNEARYLEYAATTRRAGTTRSGTTTCTTRSTCC